MRPAALLTRALDAVFPPRCVGCGAFDSYLCDRCLADSVRATGDRCPRCWTPGREDSCLRCYEHPPAFEGLHSAFLYAAAPREAVRALKFHGVSAIAPTMAAHLHETLREWDLLGQVPGPDLTIVPVPLWPARKRSRGYNQSELLARELSRLAGLPIEPNAVRRARNTRPQTEQPDAAARRRNVAGAFAPGKRPVSGAALLIDDVTTTGATLDACARAALEAGAARVYALTFARED